MATAPVQPDSRPEFYDAQAFEPAGRSCPMCGDANPLTAVRCDACGEKLDPPTIRPIEEPQENRGGVSFMLAMVGVMYHPILIILTMFLWPLWWMLGPVMPWVAAVLYLLTPVVTSVYVLFGDNPRTTYHIAGRLIFAAGMMWLPVSSLFNVFAFFVGGC